MQEALTALESLRDARQLPDEDMLMLARLQGQSGDIDGAFTTLEPMLEARPRRSAGQDRGGGDPPAARRGARWPPSCWIACSQENPTLAEARMVRARYFLNSGYPQYADADLGLLPKAEAEKPSAVTLRARALNTLGRHGEAETLLKGLMETSGQSPELLSQLADTKLYLDRIDEAQALVDEALRLSPSDPRSLYMRGRILERQIQPQQARVAYERALESSPRFAPALSRLWVLQLEQGQNKEAMETLERIYFMGEATIEEKAALAGVYAELSMQVCARAHADRRGAAARSGEPALAGHPREGGQARGGAQPRQGRDHHPRSHPPGLRTCWAPCSVNGAGASDVAATARRTGRRRAPAP